MLVMGGGELQGWYEGIVWGGEGWWIVTKAITLKHLSRKSLDCVLFLFQWRKHKLCLSEPEMKPTSLKFEASGIKKEYI